MLRYVIEKKEKQSKSAPRDHGADASWSVMELPSKKEVGTLRRTANMFIAESMKHRNTSEAASGLLVLRMAFRSDHFFIERDGAIQALAEKDLS